MAAVLKRYKKSENGRPGRMALVYQSHEHGIDADMVDPDAVRIIARLQRHGYEAYVVGGAVRDLMLGKVPKDFDIATSAEPNQIRKLFRNCRIIGKRFRLAHIFFHDGKIIEVATFRSPEAEGFHAVFGTLEEDAFRRDFSINALYYDPAEDVVVDFVGGVKDLRSRRLMPVIPRKQIFVEDPVRMIRAVKYSLSTGCRIPFLLDRRVHRDHALLQDVSPSRLSEEAFKVLQGGRSRDTVETMEKYGLLQAMFPGIRDLMGKDARFRKSLMHSLSILDGAVRTHGEHRRYIQFAYLVGDYVLGFSQWASRKRLPFSEIYHDVKELLKPVTPPNIEVDRCIVYLSRLRDLYREQGGMPDFDPALTHDVESRVPPRDDDRRRRSRGRGKPAGTAEDAREAGPDGDAVHARRSRPAVENGNEGNQPEGEGSPKPRRKRPRNRRKPSGVSEGAATPVAIEKE